MIVEPAPTSPRSPVRRTLRLLGLALPLVLLVVVVAAGVLGPQPEPVPDRGPDGSAPAGPVADGDVRNRSSVTDPFPATWIGLRVWSVEGVLAARADGDARGIVAVAGYLDYGSLAWTCVDAYLDVDRSACDGRTILTPTRVPATPDPAASGAGSIGPHLHPVFPPGARGPMPDDTPGSPRSQPIPVVILGSFDDPRLGSCARGGTGCGERFAVKRVVWVAGIPWGPTLTVDPALGVDPNIPEIQASVADGVAALGRGSLPLDTAVVRPDALGLLDEGAAAALPDLPPRAMLRPVTYVRGLVFQFDASQPVYGRDPAIGWVVIDSITGRELARGGQPAPRLAGSGVAAP